MNKPYYCYTIEQVHGVNTFTHKLITDVLLNEEQRLFLAREVAGTNDWDEAEAGYWCTEALSIVNIAHFQAREELSEQTLRQLLRLTKIQYYPAVNINTHMELEA
jgi:hypothetical protein